MADTKISLLAAGSPALSGDLLPIARAGANYSLSIANVATYMSGNIPAPVTLTEAVGSSALTITGATQTASFPALSITQTWNNAGVTFTGMKLNVTSTASAAGSLLADLQVGGSSVLSVRKDGTILGGSAQLIPSLTSFGWSWTTNNLLAPSGVVQAASFYLGSGTDAIITRDAAAAVAQRNGVNAQTLRVYNTYTDASNYERLSIGWAANVLTIGTENAGTGTARALTLAGPVTLTEAVGSSALTITGATQTASFPALSITQTWNNAGVTFTGMKLNVTSTASAAGSLLLDLQVAGASQFAVSAVGQIMVAGTRRTIAVSGVDRFSLGQLGTSNTLGFRNDGQLVWSSGTDPTTSAEITVLRDTANALALRSGVNAQTFRVYNTFTDASNYERGVFDWGTTANTLTIGAQALGTGTERAVAFVGSNVFTFKNGAGTVAMSINSAVSTSGNVYANSLNASRGGSINFTDTASRGGITAPADGVFVFKNSSAGIACVTMTPGTVATLPAAATAGAGARTFVTDSNATLAAGIGNTVAAGGANFVPVYSDGTNWKIG